MVSLLQLVPLARSTDAITVHHDTLDATSPYSSRPHRVVNMMNVWTCALRCVRNQAFPVDAANVRNSLPDETTAAASKVHCLHLIITDLYGQ